ncbi:hypothetical protein DKM19_20270 [Streptosporangium sp. 'caverna']|nr:hypothetical protein DKM19_20270 [Streptosporangium sp. 'caverna']
MVFGGAAVIWIRDILKSRREPGRIRTHVPSSFLRGARLDRMGGRPEGIMLLDQEARHAREHEARNRPTGA